MTIKTKKESVSLPTALILLSFMFLIIYFFTIKPHQGILTISSWIYAAFLISLYALMVFTGKTAIYRRIFFISFALLFFPSFIMNLVDVRGSMGLTETDIVNNETPFCHIVIPITFIQAALNKTIIFPARLTGHYASIYSMLTIWLASSIVLGRGWCSWVCFYGGWEEGTSHIARKKRLNIDKPPEYLRYFNYSMLMFLVLVSLVTASSIYCEWFCPFKLVTEYAEVTNLTSYIATIIFICTFFGLVVVMPFLTKKRFQCSTFCPFGAFQSIVDHISLYRVKIDTEKCLKCGKCISICPTLSMTEESYTVKGHPLSSCTKCGECIDNCPAGAISYGFRHQPTTKPSKNTFLQILSPSALFPFTAFSFGTIISSSFASDTISMLLTAVSGGF